MSISRKIKFATIEVIPNNKSTVLLKGIKGILQIYQRWGFHVEVTLMDGEFGHLRGEMANMGVMLNETSRDEHVGDIERFIHTVKERMRAIYNTLPFHKVPVRLVAEMAKACVFWLNSLPPHSNFGNELSPRTIVTGQKLDFKRHCRFQFGEYVQTHEEHDNSMTSRTVGALALRPTGNAQGRFYFLSLSTGRVLNRLRMTALPMPDHVVDQVHCMARQQKANPGLLFRNQSVSSVNDGDMEESSDDDDDDEYVPEDDDAGEGENAGDEYASHDYNYDDTGSIESEHNEPTDDDAIDVGDVGMGTDVDVNSGRSDDGNEAEVPENLGVDDATSDKDAEMNGVESQGVGELNNDTINQEVNDAERSEEKDSNESTEDENASIVEAHDEIENETGYNLRGNRG